MDEKTVTRVLTASERSEIHTTIARALSLLGETPNTTIELLRADGASETLALATSLQPRIAFLDVTIGGGAGIGLVHFLQSVVPGVVVVAIVPEGADQDVRLVEQAASLGASWVLLGELTGDDVLRAFGRVIPALAKSIPPLAMPPADEEPEPVASIAEVRTFRELDSALAAFSLALPAPDARKPLVEDVRRAIARCSENDRAERSTMQDPTTSAYSFSYFVDLAGREIDLARRHGRRFALATVESTTASLHGHDTRGLVELVLGAVRDTDVVARADENELLLLLPETGAKGARTLRRRILDRVQTQAGAGKPLPVRVGIATFPADGEDLSRLLRIARRRAERWSAWDSSWACARTLAQAVAWLARPTRPGQVPREGVGPLVPIEVPLRDGWALFDTIVREATRGGDATISLHSPSDATEASLGLAHGVRAASIDAMGSSSGGSTQSSMHSGNRADRERDVLSLVTGQSRLAEDATFPGLEVVAVLGEHACYGLIGRVDDGRLIALHGHDLPLIEALSNGLEQPVFRRGTITGQTPSSSAPSSVRSSRSDAMGLRR